MWGPNGCTKATRLTKIEFEPAHEQLQMKPFLKWVGGKGQIIETVLENFPTHLANYREPFLGGGSVLLAFLEAVAAGKITMSGQVYASDINPNLIALYKNIQSNVNTLIDEVKKLVEEFKLCKGSFVNRKPKTLEEARTSPESYYYWIRAKFNALSPEERSSEAASAIMLFLNKTCFRGVYREAQKGGFNVPFGHYVSPAIMDEGHLTAVSALIAGVVFSVSHFEEALEAAVDGDFVYVDPPYAPANSTSFVSYTVDGFGAENHTRLFQMCKELSPKGVKMLMSNADVALVKNAFPAPDYETKIISCRRAIHSTDPSARVNEVLINERRISVAPTYSI